MDEEDSDDWSDLAIEFFSRLERERPWKRRKLLKASSGFPRFVYKYKGLSKDELSGKDAFVKDMLINNRMWLSSVMDFNDPFDGALGIDFQGTQAELKIAIACIYQRAAGLSMKAAKREVVRRGAVLSVRKQMGEIIERHKLSSGVACLSEKPNDLLMWSHYADSHRGICLQFSVEKDMPTFCQSHPVKYSNKYQILNFIETRNGGSQNFGESMVKAYLNKSEHWSYEREQRVVRLGCAQSYLSFRPRSLVAVILGSRISDESVKYLRELIRERELESGCPTKIYRAHRHEYKYKIDIFRDK